MVGREDQGKRLVSAQEGTGREGACAEAQLVCAKARSYWLVTETGVRVRCSGLTRRKEERWECRERAREAESRRRGSWWSGTAASQAWREPAMGWRERRWGPEQGVLSLDSCHWGIWPRLSS